MGDLTLNTPPVIAQSRHILSSETPVLIQVNQAAVIPSHGFKAVSQSAGPTEDVVLADPQIEFLLI